MRLTTSLSTDGSHKFSVESSFLSNIAGTGRLLTSISPKVFGLLAIIQLRRIDFVSGNVISF